MFHSFIPSVFLTEDGFGLASRVSSLSRSERWDNALQLLPEAKTRGLGGGNVFLVSSCTLVGPK